MMHFLKVVEEVLKPVGKDLSHVGQWINDGIKIAEPIIGAVDPEVGKILTAVEQGLGNVPAGTALNADHVQSLVTATATVAAMGALKPTCCCCCCQEKTTS